MAFKGKDFPDEIFLYAASLRNPDAYFPTQHTHFGERLKWLKIEDDLPKVIGTQAEQTP